MLKWPLILNIQDMSATDDDDTEDRAADADDSALVSVRNDVPVADGGHGDEGPPVGVQHVPHSTSAVTEK